MKIRDGKYTYPKRVSRLETHPLAFYLSLSLFSRRGKRAFDLKYSTRRLWRFGPKFHICMLKYVYIYNGAISSGSKTPRYTPRPIPMRLWGAFGQFSRPSQSARFLFLTLLSFYLCLVFPSRRVSEMGRGCTRRVYLGEHRHIRRICASLFSWVSLSPPPFSLPLLFHPCVASPVSFCSLLATIWRPFLVPNPMARLSQPYRSAQKFLKGNISLKWILRIII